MNVSLLRKGGTMSSLSGRVIAVSGGAGGAGIAITRLFAEHNEQVFVIDREAARGHVDALGMANVAFVAANVFEESSVHAAFEAIMAQSGRLDVLVNVVGGYAAGQPIHELSGATWDQQMELNLRSAFLLSKYGARPMIAQAGGRIIHFAARAGRDTAANAGAYAVSKAGVIALVEVQSKELLPHHITVNAILPSIIDTPANRAAMPDADIARWPKPEQVARVVRFLASEDAALISGASIPVYGQW